MPVRQPVLPRLMLNRARISVVALSRSRPRSALARAAGYQVFETRAPAKSRQIVRGPAAANAAELASQPRACQVTRIVIGGTLSRVAPHLLAAAWSAISLCSPNVVPGLPPTGLAGVGSLSPVPAESPF